MNLYHSNDYEVVILYGKIHKNGSCGMQTFATPGAQGFIGDGPIRTRPKGGKYCIELFENFLKCKYSVVKHACGTTAL